VKTTQQHMEEVLEDLRGPLAATHLHISVVGVPGQRALQSGEYIVDIEMPAEGRGKLACIHAVKDAQDGISYLKLAKEG
jgi:hypothetical protein